MTGREYCVATGAIPIVAASYSPRHVHQPVAMSWMMEDWLHDYGARDTKVLVADMFNTRGELQALEQLNISHLTIISDFFHLERVDILVERMRFKKMLNVEHVTYIATPTSSLTARGRKLEGLKKSFIRFAPFWAQDKIMFLLHKTPLRHINLSY